LFRVLAGDGVEGTGQPDKSALSDALDVFSEKYASDQTQNKFPESQKDKVIPGLVNQLESEAKKDSPDWSFLHKIVVVLKILTREMKGIDALFRLETVRAIMKIIMRFQKSPDDSLPAVEQSYAFLVNSFIVDRFKMNKVLEDTADLNALTQNLAYHLQKRQYRPYYYLCRVFFYISLVEKIARKLIDPAEADRKQGVKPIFSLIASQLIERFQPELISDTEENKMNRLSCMELLRTCFNLSYNKDNPEMQDRLDDDTLASLKQRFEQVLAIGAETDPFGDKSVEDEFEIEAAKILAIADAAESNNEDKEFALANEDLVKEAKRELESELAEQKLVGELKSGEKKKEKEEKKLTEKEQKTWEEALKRVESGKSSRKTSVAKRQVINQRPDDIHAIKLQLINLFIMPGVRTLLPTRGTPVLQGMADILDRQAKLDPNYPTDHILSILTVLLTVSKASAEARSHFKRYVFREDADKPPGYKPNKNMDPPKYVNIRTMKDKNGNWNLRAILTKHICSFNMNLKHTLSEFLFVLCGEESGEYIRLLGFGSAAGLLADKGLPGFSQLSQQAYSLDELADRMKTQKS